MVMCCAACDISAEIDDIKLEKYNDCDLVRYSSDTCKEKIIGQNMKQNAKSERPNYVKRFYLGSPKAPIYHRRLPDLLVASSDRVQ